MRSELVLRLNQMIPVTPDKRGHFRPSADPGASRRIVRASRTHFAGSRVSFAMLTSHGMTGMF